MADLTNASQEVEITNQTTGVKCNPNPDGTLPTALIGVSGNRADVDAMGHQYISGQSTVGATLSSNPVAISGVDAAGLKRSILTDTTGAVRVSPISAEGAVSIQLLVDGAVTVINNARWLTLLSYQVPANYYMDLLKFSHMAANAGTDAMVSVVKFLGSFSNVTNAFTSGEAYTAPGFAAKLLIHITATGFTAANDSITITYVNQAGVAGRTATATILRNAVVQDMFNVTLQAGDYGVQSITQITHSAANATGTFEVEGLVTIAQLVSAVANTVYSEVLPSNGAVANAGDQVVIHYLGASSTLNTALMGTLKPR